jgi:hypothetical protein
VSNVLGVARGGTGTLTPPANGQVLIGSGGVYTPAAVTPGAGISVVGGAGSLTIANTAPNVPVALTAGANVGIISAYPNFTISAVGSVYNVSGAAGTAGTDIAVSVTNPTANPAITINVPTASAAARGALSSADWSIFNAKQTALVSGTNIKTVGGVSLLGAGDVGTLGVAYGGTGTTTSTGTGSTVLSNSPTLVTPALGTPSAAVLTNATGLPIVGGTTGTLTIARGGTGQVTAAAAIEALLPAYAGNGNKRLGLNSGATALEWTLDGGGTVTDVAALTLGTSGTDLSSSVATGTTTPVITLNVPTASASNRGALAAADWTAFNAKQAALVSGTNIKTVGGVSLLGGGDLGTLGVAYGGTGQSSYTIGDLLYASGTTALSKLADVATGNALISGGVGAAPSWGKIGLTTHVSGTLPNTNGGTGQASAFTASGIVYASSTTVLATGSGLLFDGSNLAMGGAIAGSVNLFLQKGITGGTSAFGIAQTAVIASGVTSSATGFQSRLDTAAAAFICSTARDFIVTGGVIGAGSAITTQNGFTVDNTVRNATTTNGFLSENTQLITVGKTYYGFRSQTAIATGGGITWSLYFDGSAPSAFSGLTRFGGTTAPTVAVDVTGAIAATTTVRTGTYTVATLPSASGSGAGAIAYITDAVAATFGAAPTGGGSAKTTVYSDGTSWLMG